MAQDIVIAHLFFQNAIIVENIDRSIRFAFPEIRNLVVYRNEEANEFVVSFTEHPYILEDIAAFAETRLDQKGNIKKSK